MTNIQDLRNTLNQKFFERSDLIDGMLTVLLSKQTLFMLGSPGVAKSAIACAISESISGSFFSWLLSKFSVPDELFGSISIQGLENNKYERITTNKLPEAKVCFLDEIFKGSSAILNILLPVINERTFYNGNTPTKIPLEAVYAASNEIPQGEELAAIYDRFILKFVVEPISEDANFAALLTGGSEKIQMPKISEKELQLAQAEAEKVTIDKKVIDKLIVLHKEIKNAGIYVSDRKWRESIKAIKAYAYLNGKTSADEDDLTILKNILWSTPDQIKMVAKIVNKFTNDFGEKISQMKDGADEIMDNLNSGKINGVEAHKKVKFAQLELEKLSQQHPSNAGARKAFEYVRDLNMKICKDVLGLTI